MEKHSDTHKNNGNNLWGLMSSFLVGGLVGSFTMLLVAPQSGKKTRAKIQQRTIELRDQAVDTVEDALAQTRYKARRIRRSVNKQAEAIHQRGQEAVDEQKEQLSSLVEASKSTVQGVLNSHTPGR